MRGFYFVPLQCSPIQAFTVRFVLPMQLYRPHHKMRTGLCRRFSCDYARSTIHDTRPTQTAIIPHTTRWSTSQRRSASSTYQIPAPRRMLYRPAQPPYYNNVYKGAPLLWIHARQCSIPQTMQTRRGQLLPSADCWQALHPAGQSSSRSAAGGAEPLAACRRISFRAFAR